MKLLIVSPVLYGFWYQPTYSLIGIVALIFTVQVIAELCSLSSELMRSKTLTNQSYEEIKELFNNGLDEEVDELVQTVSTTSQIKCIELTLNEWTYRDIQLQCKSLSIPKVNRKKAVLVQELLSLCT